MPDECHMEDCGRRAAVAYYVRWTERHKNYNVWKACEGHAVLMQESLSTGRFSGGVVPVELLSTSA